MNQFTASLWGDESFAAVLAQKSIFDVVATVAKDTAPPLYYLCLHFWMKFFGTSEISIRSLSFVFFLLSCFFVFLIAKKLFNDTKTGILAFALCFFNPFLFPYAFEGRMYACLLLTITASTYFFITKNWFLYIIASTLALYTHHFAVFPIFAQFLWTIPNLFKKNGLWQTLKPYFIIGLLYLPWLFPFYYQLSLIKSGFWLGKPNLQNLKDLWSNFFLTTNGELESKILMVGVYGSLIVRRWQDQFKKDLFLVSLFLLPVILTYFISQIFTPIFYERYLLYAIVPIILLFISSRRKISWVFIILIFATQVPTAWYYFNHPIKKPFRELALYVRTLDFKDTSLINFNDQAHHLFESRYYGLKAPIYAPKGDMPFFTGTALMTSEDVIQDLPKTKNIIAITSGNPKNILLPNYKFIKDKEFGGFYLVWLGKIK